MGCILESTTEMGDYEVETRRESFYIHGIGWTVDHNSLSGGGSVEILYTDIPKIRAALDLAEEHRRS